MKSSNQGYTNANDYIGYMYDAGLGVPQNYSKALEFYTLAADKGNAYSQDSLGFLYENGKGVTQNYAKAVELYTLASDKGNITALSDLARMYELGLGVKQDNNKALELYTKANNTAKIALLKNKISSQKVVQLFGIDLQNATRESLETACTTAKLKPFKGHVGPKYMYDKYIVTNQLKEAKELEIGYTDTQKFAIATYTFPSKSDTQQVKRIIDMVSSKYGLPASSIGSYAQGEVKATWEFGDIIITVSRKWPNTTTTLEYVNKVMYETLNKQTTKQNESNHKSIQQSNAF
jgi:hypothetical protein